MKSFGLNKIGQTKVAPILLLIILSVFVTSCYTDYGLTSSEHDIVITQYDKTTDFTKYKTFAIIDSVFHLTEDGEDSEYLSRRHDDFIIQTIVENMENLGYDRITDTLLVDSVDVVISVASQGTKVDQYYYGGWWGGYYPGWGYPGYGWGYPGYMGSTTYYVGTLFINYADAENLENPVVDVEWNAILNGLLNNDSYQVTQSRLEERINTAFNQSPYLEVSN